MFWGRVQNRIHFGDAATNQWEVRSPRRPTPHAPILWQRRTVGSDYRRTLCPWRLPDTHDILEDPRRPRPSDKRRSRRLDAAIGRARSQARLGDRPIGWVAALFWPIQQQSQRIGHTSDLSNDMTPVSDENSLAECRRPDHVTLSTFWGHRGPCRHSCKSMHEASSVSQIEVV